MTLSFFADNWPVWTVAALLVWAAWIDGKELRVPNWLTFSMAGLGLLFNAAEGGWVGKSWTGMGPVGEIGLWGGLLGLVAGLVCLLPLCSVGGMGAGDVKLMAGIGAWLGWQVTAYAFVATVFVGAAMAIVMMVLSGDVARHVVTAKLILHEWRTVRNPWKLSEIARARKPSMTLLPYGIPMCIGSIGYFLYAGMLI